MTKKIKIFIALTLAVQLLVPSILLAYHYSVLNTAKGTETEYTFRLKGLYFGDDYKYDDSFAEIEDGPMVFYIEDVFMTSNRKLTPVLSPKGNVVEVKALKNEDTDVWFYTNYYYESSTVQPENFSFVNEEEARSIKYAIRNEFNQYTEEREYVYLTAKIYKGIFIPTGIYFRGEKIIEINMQNNL